MPIERYFDRLTSQENPWSYILRFPSLLWLDYFLNLGGSFLHTLCGVGVIFSILALFNWYRGISLLFSWLFYLSLVTFGSPFLSFQWDNLLLETGLLAIWLPGFRKRDQKPSLLILLLTFLLLFRLMFFSGYVKLVSNDPVWWDLSALSLHFETQPLPHFMSWYFHQLPTIILKVSTAIMFFIELIAPFFIFLIRHLRHTAGILFIALMLLISVSGNYTFFNLLTIILCLLLFDDCFYQRFLPYTFLQKHNYSTTENYTKRISKIVCFIMVTLALITEGRRWLPISQYPVISHLYGLVQPFRSVNTYGLFADMTTSRSEIIFEISSDGENWQEMQFKWKPVELGALPGWVQPHQPRLDWQLWFAGLYYNRVLPLFQQQFDRAPESYDEIHRFIYQRYRRMYYRHIWMHNFMEGILQKRQPVINLTAHENWPEGSFYLRAWLYDYRFTRVNSYMESYDKQKNWWVRDKKRLLFPAFKL